MQHLFAQAEANSIFDEIDAEAEKAQARQNAVELFYDIAEHVHDILKEDMKIPPRTSMTRNGVRITISFDKVKK